MLDADAEPRSAEQLSDPVPVEFEFDLRGGLKYLINVPRTGVDLALNKTPRSKPAATGLLADLPEPVVATALVDLDAPLSPAAFYDLVARYGAEHGETQDMAVYLQPLERPWTR